MTTTARLGIDILARNRTGSGFAAVERGLTSLSRSTNQLKSAMLGLAGGNLLEAVVRSLVGINRQTMPVKTAFDRLSSAWGQFALKVGESGLNAALVSAANRIGAMITGTNGLAKSIGAFMGGAVTAMATVFEAIGRGIAFTYDNAALFGRLIATISLAAFAQRVIGTAAAFFYFAKTVRSTGIIMAAFQTISRANLLVFLALAAGIAYATDSVDQLKSGIETMWAKVKDIFPMIADAGGKLMEGLGFDMAALSQSLADTSRYVDRLPAVTDPATSSLAKLGAATGQAGVQLQKGGQQINTFAQNLKTSTSLAEEAAHKIGASYADLFKGLVDGSLRGTEAIKAFAATTLTNLSQMATSSAFKTLASLFGGGVAPGQQGGGILGSLLEGFAGAFASGGHIPSGQWGVVGEKGPEFARGPLDIIPSSKAAGMGQSVVQNVYIQTPDVQSFRKSQGQLQHQLSQAVSRGQRYA